MKAPMSLEKIVVARWQDWSGDGIQHLVLREGPREIVAEAVVIATEDGSHLAARFRIECDGAWKVRKFAGSIIGDERRIELLTDGNGQWRDHAGAELPHLAGAIDVDLPLTPFTNTLPIRRLGLAAGQSADLVVAYILLPEFKVVTDPQRYVCLEPLRRYRYESLDSDFMREVEVDRDGLVTLYPGLFKRLL
jgi:hypothetical protein